MLSLFQIFFKKSQKHYFTLLYEHRVLLTYKWIEIMLRIYEVLYKAETWHHSVRASSFTNKIKHSKTSRKSHNFIFLFESLLFRTRKNSIIFQHSSSFRPLHEKNWQQKHSGYQTTLQFSCLLHTKRFFMQNDLSTSMQAVWFELIINQNHVTNSSTWQTRKFKRFSIQFMRFCFSGIYPTNFQRCFPKSVFKSSWIVSKRAHIADNSQIYWSKRILTGNHDEGMVKRTLLNQKVWTP